MAKRRSSVKKGRRKKVASAPRRRSRAPFVGDQILATYHFLSCTCGFGILGVISALGFGVALGDWLPRAKEQLVANAPKVDWNQVFIPQFALVVGILALVLFLLGIWLGIGLWKGKRAALIIYCVLHFPVAALAIMGGGQGQSAGILSIVVAVYCILRLAGSVGP